jgi:16S rRNA (cytidine1402-2'-O)-methyltransferase
VPELVRRAQEEGTSIAVVSDAGTPGISDPGAELAAACADARVPTVPLPGACAAVAALSVAGLPSLEWVFFGFLPSAGSERKKQLARVAGETRACVLYEAPHRLLSTLQGLVDAGASAAAVAGAGRGTTGVRRVLCARELTKVHEELYRGTLDEALRHYGEGGAGIVKGEFTIVLHPDGARAASDAALAAGEQRESVAALLAEQAAAGALLSAAVRDVCAQTGAPKREVYSKALEMPRGDWQRGSTESD